MMEEAIDILLVEDRIEDAELAMMGLKKHNLINSIVWVKDGEEALEYLLGTGRFDGRDSSIRPKLVLLDLKMPKVDGIEVLKTIRSTEKLKHIPVIVMTTSQEDKDLMNAYNLNVNAYILKPVDFTSFVDAMQAMGLFWLLLNKRPY
ncbi:MAG: response regulator [Bacteroidetes bacterium]|nr:response regulator [Bacteroidota bacterium]